MILDQLRRSAQDRLEAWAQAQGIDAPAISFSAPPPHVPADVSIPWPLAAAKLLKRKPLDVAAAAAAALKDVAEAEALPSPPGFINLRLSAEALSRNAGAILSAPDRYGEDPAAAKRSVLVEFVSANPTGPVHLASGRAATLGDSLVRILRRRGHKAHGEYYVNDAGRQVELLGLSVKARFDELHGRPSAMPEDGYQGDYIRAVAAAVDAREGASWPASDFSRFAIGRMLAMHREDMEAFGVRFDRWFLETELHATKAVERTLEKLKKLGKTYEKDGAVWLGSSEEEGGDDKDRVLVRKDGRPTYFLADIAYHQDKLDRGFSELIDIWGADHHGYVGRMRAAILALGYPADAFHPIIHQLVHLYRGGEMVKMSKRAGEFITLRELVAEAGLDACRFFFALRTPNSHMNFDVDLAKKQSQENPVYYVQYVHARIRSIFREAEGRGLKALSADDLRGRGLALAEPAERALAVKLAWFPDALRTCERELSPHPLAGYLMELASLFHPFYEACRVVDESARETSEARLTLCGAVGAVIREGLGLLGVSAPEKM